MASQWPWVLTGALLLVAIGATAFFMFRDAVVSLRALSTRRAARRHKSTAAKLLAEDETEFARGLEELRDIRGLAVREALIEEIRPSLEAAHRDRLVRAYDRAGVTAHYAEVLSSGRRWVDRAVAANRLGQIGSAGGVPALLECLRDLADEDEDVRGAAVRALGRVRDPEALPILIDALDYPEASLPPRVAEVITLYGDEATPLLVRELRNSDSETRRMWAADILGWVGGSEAGLPLVEALCDVNPEVRAKAAGSLGRLKYTVAAERLVEMLLSDPVPFVRTRAAQALGAVGIPRAVDYLVRALKDPEWWVRTRAVEALAELGDMARDSLVVALEDCDQEVRRRAAMSLERMGFVHKCVQVLVEEGYRADVLRILYLVASAGVTEVILGEMVSAPEPARTLLVRLAGRVGRPEAGPVIHSMLLGPLEPATKSRALEALGQLRYEPAIPEIVASLSNEDQWVRKAAAVALGAMGPSEEHWPALRKMLRDSLPSTRAVVCRLAARMAGEEVQCDIGPLLQDPVAEVRAEAARAVGARGWTEYVDQLQSLLQDPAEEVRLAAVAALGQCGRRQAVPALLAAAEHASADMLKEIVKAVAASHSGAFRDLAELLPDTPAREQVGVLLELAACFPDEDALEFVESHLTARDPWLRSRAVYALRSFEVERMSHAVLRAFEDPDERVRDAAVMVTGLTGARLLGPAVIERIHDPNVQVRFHSALTLGLLGPRGLAESLGELLDDRSMLVRCAAAFSLSLCSDPTQLNRVRYYTALPELLNKAHEVFVRNSPDPLVAHAVEEASLHANLETRLFLGQSRAALEKELLEMARQALPSEERTRALELCQMVATGESYTTALAILRNDPSADVRSAALDLLLKIRKDEEVAEIVSDLLFDPHPRLRMRAAAILGRMDYPGVVESLARALDTGDRDLREEVTTALAGHLQRSGQAVNQLLRESPASKTGKLGVVWLLGKVQGEPAFGALVKLLEDRDRDVRAAAVGAIAKYSHEQAFPLLERCLGDIDARVRAAAVNAVARMGGPASRRVLAGMLEDPDAFVRRRAAVALVQARSPVAREHIEQLETESEELKPVWLAGGVMLGVVEPARAAADAEAVEFLQELFPVEQAEIRCREALDPAERRVAFRVLQALSLPTAKRAARVLVNDPDYELRLEAGRVRGSTRPVRRRVSS